MYEVAENVLSQVPDHKGKKLVFTSQLHLIELVFDTQKYSQGVKC